MFVPLCLTLFTVLGPDSREIDNPKSLSWTKFPKGTSITHKQVITNNPGSPAEQTIEVLTTYTLAEAGKDKVVVEMQQAITANGKVTEKPVAKIELPTTVKLARGENLFAGLGPAYNVERGEEKLTLARREMQTTWYRAKREHKDGGGFESTVWYSEAAPGLLVKSEFITRGANGKVGQTNVTEVVDIRRP